VLISWRSQAWTIGKRFDEWFIGFFATQEGVSLVSGKLEKLVRPDSSPSHLLNHEVVLCMRSDPEPYGCVVLDIAQGSPMNPDSDGVNWLARMHSLELKRRVFWIGLPSEKSLSGQNAYFCW